MLVRAHAFARDFSMPFVDDDAKKKRRDCAFVLSALFFDFPL